MKIVCLIKNKIRSKRGETLTETLSSLLIIVPAMVMLAAAIVAAARINHDARTSQASELPKFSETSGDARTITISGDVSVPGGTINWCKETNSIYYYFR